MGGEGGKFILYPENGNGRNHFSSCATKGALPTKKFGLDEGKMGKFSQCEMLDSDIGVRDLCRIFLFHSGNAPSKISRVFQAQLFLGKRFYFGSSRSKETRKNFQETLESGRAALPQVTPGEA